MRENRQHGSEGGEAGSLPYPYRGLHPPRRGEPLLLRAALYQPTEPVTHDDNGHCHCERSEAIQGLALSIL